MCTSSLSMFFEIYSISVGSYRIEEKACSAVLTENAKKKLRLLE